jgi:hypothetical protein
VIGAHAAPERNLASWVAASTLLPPGSAINPAVTDASAASNSSTIRAHRAALSRPAVEIGVDSDQFSDAIANTRWRRMDDAGVEGEAVIEAFAHIVVNGDVALGGGQNVASTSGRCPEHHQGS